jgi:hydroxyethylthiazole kinase-like uncharacterized protein yjeF
MEDWLEPVYDAESMRAVDSWAIEDQGVASLELMEAAGGALARHVASLAPQGPVRIVCGKGNNGGDGLVAARRLAETGFEVDALLLAAPGDLSGDAKANFDRFPAAREVDPEDLGTALEGSGAIVDAIFGTGFEGAPRSPIDIAIRAVNAAGAPVVACDIASGVNASSGEVEGEVVDADATVSFHAPKVGHLVAPGKERSGSLEVAPIGIPDGAPAPPAAGAIAPRVLELAPRRGSSSTKFTSGQVVIVGGSRGLTGAVCMAAQAATRAGAGYATVAVPAELESIFEVKLTEVMSRGCPGDGAALVAESVDAALEAAEGASAVVLGCGLGRRKESLAFAREVARRAESPLLIDADGLNAHAGQLDSLRSRSAPTVLTPHAGELGRLLERSSEEIGERRLQSAREAAKAGGAVVLLKGDDTIVTDGERVAINRLSAPALATAGTGDTLSGTIGALMARGLDAFEAACAGAFAGARAGRIAAERVGLPESVVAGDVCEALPSALNPCGDFVA